MVIPDGSMKEKKHKNISPLGKKVEAFALNLLHLIHGVRVYPAKHPALIEVAEKVHLSASLGAMGSLTIGVTPSELIVSGEFIAGKAIPLASMLHRRKILRILWSKDATLEDIWTFAQVISTPKLEGEELRKKLHSQIFSIDIEVLKLDQIHSKVMDTTRDPEEDSEYRRRRAWLILMTQEAPVDQLASALVSQEFWDTAKDEWTKSGLGDSEGFSQFLLRLGERLEKALALLPAGQREDILNYLAQMGKCLAVKDLVRIVGREGEESKKLGLGQASLLRDIDAERFLDLLAGLAAAGEEGIGRFIEVYRRFTPITQTHDILSMVRSRVSQNIEGGYSPDIWKRVESLILNLNENPFMDSEYSDSLEFLMGLSGSCAKEDETASVLESPDQYLDRLFLALGAEEGELFQKRLVDRIKSRADQLGPFGVLQFIRIVDQTLPRLLDSNPYFVKTLFEKGLSALGKASFMEKQALIHFAVNHEKCLLDTALRALIEEKKVSTRYFLVNLLSCFSYDATPIFVSKSRSGPWFVTRNLTIVLGQQGFRQALPHLKSLSNHNHPKVKKEAMKALKRVECLNNTFSMEQVEEVFLGGSSQNVGIEQVRYGTGCS